jgi:chromosome segregation protein
MRIRKLEMQGFKSFADRTTFHFGDGIAAVVGPNGCGKSNIVDATRWCIGEQSARSLRGDAMSDVIFGGSAGRAPVQFAEVSLTFHSGDEPFPGIWARFAELEVTRRLYRDGTSEYLVNREKMRLRDIHELFLDTGAGNRLYAFIEQGRIGQIVHARPEELRALVEEAAGISRYKARREETTEKLASSRASLERVADLADEVGRQLRSAERQVQRAFKARALDARIRQEQVAVGLMRFSGLAADRKVLGERARSTAALRAEADRAVARHEEDLERRREATERVEAEGNRIRDELAEVETRRQVEESAAMYQAREMASGKERLARLELDASAAAREVADARAEQGEQARNARDAAGRLAELRAQAARTAEGHRVAAERLVQARSGCDVARVAEGEARARLARVKAEHAGMGAARTTLADRQARLEAAQREEAPAGLEAEVQRLRGDLARAEAAVAQAAEVVRAAGALATGAEAARSAAEQAVRQAESASAAHAREVATRRARVEALQEVERRGDDLPDGLRAARAHPAAMGLLVEHLRIPADVEAAVVRAMEGALDAVIVPDVATALAVARACASSRVSLAIRGEERGRTGLGARVEGSEAGLAVLSRVLPSADVADDLAAALAAWREGQTVVDRAGNLVRADGIVVLGSGDGGVATTALRRRRERTEADVALLAADAENARFEEAVRAAREGLVARDTEAVAAREAVGPAAAAQRSAELAALEARHRVREREAEMARRMRRSGELLAEARAVADESRALEARAVAAEAGLAAAEAHRVSSDDAVRRALIELEAAEPAEALARDAVQAVRLEAAAWQARGQASQMAAAAAENRAARAEQRAQQIAAERSDMEHRLTQLALDAVATAANLQSLGETQGEVRTRLEAARERVREEKERLKGTEGAARAARERRDLAVAEHLDADAALARVRGAIDLLRREAEEQNGLSLAGALDRLDRDGQLLLDGWEPDPAMRQLGAEGVATLRFSAAALVGDEAARTAALVALRDQRFKLGEIDPEAEAQFRELRGRSEEMARQRADLQEAMEIIERALAKLNATCRERFRDTFDMLQGHFAGAYPRLVGGGSARLQLTNEDDLLTCGVEMLVQPPGKRVQTLTLLSGGEKAMAAIALIFSLFKVRPSPFCLLDEVDAPLDEGNGARFNDMLREMSASSQFIVVTHNKKTMECADTLYGLTMPEPGTSRLVSVQLES